MKENKVLHAFHNLTALVRLLIAVALAGIVFYIVKDKSGPVQFMAVWICFAFANLMMYFITMFTAHPDEISHIAKNQDTSLTLIFLVTVTASFVSLFAVVLLLRILPKAGDPNYYYHVALSVASVACSWFLIHTLFTFHYAYLFYTCES